MSCTGATCNHAFPPILLVDMGHLVVCSPQLEAEYGLQVLPLEHHIALESIAQIGRPCEGGFFDDFVDAGCENQTQVLPFNLDFFRNPDR